MRPILKTMAEGTDYFADVGDKLRIVAAIAVAPFAVLFSFLAVMAPIATLCIGLVEHDWSLAAIVLGAGLFEAMLAIFLCWFTLRLWRGRRAANGITVLPAWLVRVFLVGFLTPWTVAVAGGIAIWAYHEGVAGKTKMALLAAALAYGLVVSAIRALPKAFTLLGKRGPSDPLSGADSI